MSDGSEDIVLTINRVGVAINHLFARFHLTSRSIQSPAFKLIVGSIGQGGNLVLVVRHRSPYLPFPILGIEEDSIKADIHTIVGEFAFVRPHLRQACDVTHRATCQQIGGTCVKVFDAECQTIAEQIEFHTHIETVGGFPLNFGVLDVAQHKRSGTVHELHVAEIGAHGIVIDIVVTAHFIARREFGIVNP